MVNFKLEKFEGPLDLLLQLIEAEKLDITEVSLSKVADQYLAYLESVQELNPEELADFLVVAAKLLVIKSRALLPELSLTENEVAADSLERQLKIYKAFQEAAKQVHILLLKKQVMCGHEKLPALTATTFFPPAGLTIGDLQEIYQKIVGKIQPVVELPKRLIAKSVSLQEKISSIREKIMQQMLINFDSLVTDTKNKIEKVVSFLAILELIKQHEVVAEQEATFGSIVIKKREEENKKI